MKKKDERRRGVALETAILDAAWAELAESGYVNLTMEAVAARAQTSRPVIARRWPDRPQLVLAAIHHAFASWPLTVPDMGSLRDEMVTLMRHSRDRGAAIGMLAIVQIGNYLRETYMSPQELRDNILGGEAEVLEAIFQRAVNRGEVDAKTLTPRIVNLVPDLLRHELLMTRQSVSDETIAEIVDTILMPLVEAKSC